MKNCTGVNCPMQKGYDNANCKISEHCPYVTRPATVADCIRAMSDAELAYFLAYAWGEEIKAWQTDYSEVLAWLRESKEKIYDKTDN